MPHSRQSTSPQSHYMCLKVSDHIWHDFKLLYGVDEIILTLTINAADHSTFMRYTVKILCVAPNLLECLVARLKVASKGVTKRYY